MTRVAVPVATLSALLALLSAVIPVLSGHVDWARALSFHLHSPFSGAFGGLTSSMAGLYLIGFAAPAFESASCHVGETINPEVNVPRAMYARAAMSLPVSCTVTVRNAPSVKVAPTGNTVPLAINAP